MISRPAREVRAWRSCCARGACITTLVTQLSALRRAADRLRGQPPALRLLRRPPGRAARRDPGAHPRPGRRAARWHKDEAELTLLRRAIAISDEAFTQVSAADPARHDRAPGGPPDRDDDARTGRRRPGLPRPSSPPGRTARWPTPCPATARSRRASRLSSTWARAISGYNSDMTRTHHPGHARRPLPRDLQHRAGRQAGGGSGHPRGAAPARRPTAGPRRDRGGGLRRRSSATAWATASAWKSTRGRASSKISDDTLPGERRHQRRAGHLPGRLGRRAPRRPGADPPRRRRDPDRRADARTIRVGISG